MRKMKPDYFFATVSESDLNELLAGREAGRANAWIPSKSIHQRIKSGSMGVLWKKQQSAKGVQPLLLVVHEKELRRLYGRLAQLRSDLSPLTAWCHVITPDRFKCLDETVRSPDLSELEAAWTGLIIAEARLLSARPVANIRVSACLATQTFAVARTFALWNDVSLDGILERFDTTNCLFRGKVPESDQVGYTKLRTKLLPIWTSLAALSGPDRITSELRPVVESLRVLKEVRQTQDDNEAGQFVAPLLELVPEVQSLEKLKEMSPEQRLQQFDRLVESLDAAVRNKEAARQVILTLVAGYLVTVAAGGSPSLSLADNVNGRWPEIMAWAYTIGGIGEPVVWASGFEGLGRFVARELMRPFRLDESPTCDFAHDEGMILLDKELSDPLVHLKIKQARILTVALLPGVNVFVPVSDAAASEVGRYDNEKINRHPSEATTRAVSNSDPLAILADSIWPYLESRVETCLNNSKSSQSKPEATSKRRATRAKRSPPKQLPLER